ncbi:GNAT family N-acetyltransferase [Aliihoeflea sp. PC F10.4]
MGSSDVVIRRAAPSDHDTLAALIGAAYATLDDERYDREALVAAIPLMSRPNPQLLACGTYYVAELDGEPAACGGWTREEPGTGKVDEGVAHIRHFAADPRFARRGTASALLRYCLRQAHAAKIERMMSQSTLPAEPFYAFAGFRRLKIVETKMGEGVALPVVLMERVIP